MKNFNFLGGRLHEPPKGHDPLFQDHCYKRLGVVLDKRGG